MPTRRQILAAMAALPIAGLRFPGLAWAGQQGESRLAVIVLRGGMDGLSAVPAHGDPDFAGLRGVLDLGKPTDGAVLDLDGTFGLHPSFTTLHALYGKGEMAVLHASASPYRDRSHFAGQDVLENGTTSDRGARDGWLGRAVQYTGPAKDGAVAVRETIPLLLRGGKGVTSWAPSALPAVDEDTLQRVSLLYEDDPLFAEALSAAVNANAIAGDGKPARGANQSQRFSTLMQAAGRFLAAPGGPLIAVVDLGGWDTHSLQTGRLERQFAALDKGIGDLQAALGETWRRTAVLTITEFGRTAAVNGTGGTDHGTGGVSFLLGGAVNGSRVIADWPGLAKASLLDGRDLRPTTDTRAVAKGILADHMKVAASVLDTAVFPDSAAVKSMPGLIRG